LEFPSFGDATAYEELGRACASAISGRGGSPFDACYHPLRPPGAALFMALPFLLTRDPVDVHYIALTLNLSCLTLAIVATVRLLVGDDELLPGWRPGAAVLATATFLVLLLNLVSHVPVRLADLPALALYLCSLAAGTATGGAAVRAALPRRYFVAGLLAAAATLVKVSQLPFSLALLAGLQLAARGLRIQTRAACAAAFLLGLSPAALQVANVWSHSGEIWFYERAFMQAHFSYPGREQGIEGVAYTLPQPNAYVTHATPPVSYPSLLVLRAYAGLSRFEWAVYHGAAWRGRLWTLSPWELARAWILVLGYLGLSAWATWRAAPGLGALNGAALGVALITAVSMHSEPRYYAFPRAVLWLTSAFLGLRLLRAPFLRRALRAARMRRPEGTRG
jgi:hypothetical protein